MNEVYILEWSFSPPDYFEEPIFISNDAYEMNIQVDRVEARVKAEFYDEEHKLRDQLHELLRARFLGVQTITHKPFELSGPRVSKLHPDGSKYSFVSLETILMRTHGITVDFSIEDKNGNIIADSRTERIEKKKKFAELAAKYRPINTTVVSLLDSNNAAVMDPDNELVHLYEIREALATEFRGEKEARNILGISEGEWRR